MSADNQNITLKAGDTVNIIIPVKDSSGNPVSFTNPVAIWSVGNFVNSHIVLLKSTANTLDTGTTISLTNNFWTFNISLYNADTQNILPGTYYHQARIIDGMYYTTITTGTLEIQRTI